MGNYLKALCVGLVISLTLISCDPFSQKGADGYVFEEKEYEKVELAVSVIVIQDQKQFDELAETWAPGVEGLQAFSRLQPSIDRCIIYVKDPTWQYNPEFYGHEFAHCVWGRFHDARNQLEVRNGHRPKEL